MDKIGGIMEKNVLIEKIVQIEHEFFTKTKGIGGPAPCQSQTKTFFLARTGYWNLYPETILESYLADLEKAVHDGENLVTLKYAYMMESTSPEEYKMLKDRLPIVDESKKKIANSIVSINMLWEEDVIKNHPEIEQKNRPLYSKEDTLYRVSIETYLRGELFTYSQKTLELILVYYMNCMKNKINLVYENLKFLNEFSKKI